MTQRAMGLRDVPIAKRDEELLGLSEYADALTTFIVDCDTPMTIALQGDWGSGKTSLMNLVRQSLQSAHEGKVQTVWFNTWQYSQFAMADSLALSMISHFIDQVGKTDARPAKEALGKIWKGVKVGAAIGASIAVGRAGGDQQALKDLLDGGSADPATGLKELKEELERMVEKRADVERFVVFIDDLDRLVPVRAVELLENLKLFLDIKKCVYILACDYQVVVQGLKQKFQMSEAELKGKSFFDKIIQVPFNMPITQYRVHAYFDGLLDRIGVPHDDSDTKDYVELVNYSVGFNPRSMKRLFNTLLLLRLVAERKQILDQVHEHADASETSKILFAILCMQSAYDGAYRYFTRTDKVDDELFARLRDEASLTDDTALEELRTELGPNRDRNFYRRLALFMDAFYRAIQLRSDTQDGANETLSDEESKTLRRIMNFSAVVSTEQAAVEVDYDERQYNRSLAKDVAHDLNDAFASEVGEMEGDLDRKGFYLYQQQKTSDVEIYLWSNKFGFGISFSLEADAARAALYCYYKRSAPHCSRWATSSLGTGFPDLAMQEGHEPFATLGEVRFAAEDDWRAKGEKFTTFAREVAKRFVPVFAEAHRNPDAHLQAAIAE